MLLLDTDVVSELRKIRAGRADPNVTAWAETLDMADLFLSVITIHELEIGVLLAQRRDPQQGAMLRKWLETLVLPTFDGPHYRRRGRCRPPRGRTAHSSPDQ